MEKYKFFSKENMQRIACLTCLLIITSVGYAFEPHPIIEDGKIIGKLEHPITVYGEIAASSDGTKPRVLHWMNTGEHTAGLKVFPDQTDWSQAKALLIRFYASGMLGKRFKVLVIPRTDPTEESSGYYHETLKIESEGWNEIVIPFTSFEGHKTHGEIGDVRSLVFLAYGWELPADQGLKLELSDILLVD